MKNAKGKLFLTLCLLLALFIVLGPYGDSRVSAVDSSTYKSLSGRGSHRPGRWPSMPGMWRKLGLELPATTGPSQALVG